MCIRDRLYASVLIQICARLLLVYFLVLAGIWILPSFLSIVFLLQRAKVPALLKWFQQPFTCEPAAEPFKILLIPASNQAVPADLFPFWEPKRIRQIQRFKFLYASWEILRDGIQAPKMCIRDSHRHSITRQRLVLRLGAAVPAFNDFSPAQPLKKPLVTFRAMYCAVNLHVSDVYKRQE